MSKPRYLSDTENVQGLRRCYHLGGQQMLTIKWSYFWLGHFKTVSFVNSPNLSSVTSLGQSDFVMVAFVSLRVLLQMLQNTLWVFGECLMNEWSLNNARCTCHYDTKWNILIFQVRYSAKKTIIVFFLILKIFWYRKFNMSFKIQTRITASHEHVN